MTPQSSRFPVLWQWRRDEEDRAREVGCPRDVPWELLAEHEEQAIENHDQTLRQLAARGGLGPCEMVAILEDRRWHRMAIESAIRLLQEHVDAFLKRTLPDSWETFDVEKLRRLANGLEVMACNHPDFPKTTRHHLARRIAEQLRELAKDME